MQSQLNLETLKKRALDHLTAQLTMQTYLHELFCPFTSKCAFPLLSSPLVSVPLCLAKHDYYRYEEVRKLELLAVIKHWDELKGSEALKEKMVDVVSGKLPHASQILADLLLRTSIVKPDEAEVGPQARK